MGCFGCRKSDEQRPERSTATPEWLRGVEENTISLGLERQKKRDAYMAYSAEFEFQWGALVVQGFKDVRLVLKRHRKVGGIVAPRKGRPIRDNQYAWSLSAPSVVLDEWTTEHGQLLPELRLTISDAGERYIEIKGDVRDPLLPYEAPIQLGAFEKFSEEHMQQAFRELVGFWLDPDVR